jgi:copper chaperone CopZ
LGVTKVAEEILAALLGLSTPEVIALRLGTSLVTELVRHPNTGSSRSASLISHTPGRLRIRVAAVKNAPAVAKRVEKRVVSLPGVRTASASPVTGTILVTHDENVVDAHAILRAAELSTAALRTIPAESGYRLASLEAVAA